MNTTRNNPFDLIDGPHLREAIRFFTEHHKPSLLLDCAILSAQARGHYGHQRPVLSVSKVPTLELLKIVKGKRVADAYVAEREIRLRVGRDTPLPMFGGGIGRVCFGHENQIY